MMEVNVQSFKPRRGRGQPRHFGALPQGECHVTETRPTRQETPRTEGLSTK